MVEGGVRNGPRLTAAAYRYGLGDQVTPPAELAFYLVAEKFGIPPWQVAESPLSDVLQTLELMSAVAKGEATRAKRSTT